MAAIEYTRIESFLFCENVVLPTDYIVYKIETFLRLESFPKSKTKNGNYFWRGVYFTETEIKRIKNAKYIEKAIGLLSRSQEDR